MENHWEPEPGIDPDRPQLMWFLRLTRYPQVVELARSGQERLAGLGGLDLVPPEWLHMTTLIAGYADQITPDQVQAMTRKAAQLLAGTPPAAITLSRILYHPRAVMLEAAPREALQSVLTACQLATAEATGHDGRLYHDPWIPHITLAYGNTPRPAGPVIEALGRELPATRVTITTVSLISQAPSQQWTWHLVRDIPIGNRARSGTPVT
jgi:2'-5' RNA ligase